MPTPIQHLVVADAILSDLRLPAHTLAFLRRQRAAFLFGNTAPDVQTVSGQPREATHFFNVPLDSDRPAHEAMFSLHPRLGDAGQLPAAHAAFMAGYIAHLLLDVIWVRDIFAPVFGPEAGWGRFDERLFLHNVLRAWCDRRDQARIDGDAGDLLTAVTPDRWLPFTDDIHLRRWRDLLVEQLAPGASIRTVEVFAARAQLPPDSFERILNSPEKLEGLIFSRLPRSEIDRFYDYSLTEAIDLIARYLQSLGGVSDAG
jgi:hypothetical protein